jgi:hypothetical protein
MKHKWHGKIELGDRWLRRRMKSGLTYAGGGVGALFILIGFNILVGMSGYNLVIFYAFYAFPATFIVFGTFIIAWRTQSSTMYIPMDEQGIGRYYFSGRLKQRLEALLREGDYDHSKVAEDPKRTTYELPSGLRLQVRYKVVDPADWKERYLLVIALKRITVENASLAKDIRRVLDRVPEFDYPEADDEEH